MRQVSYPPYIFECFLYAPVYDRRSAAQVGNGAVLFKLEKQTPAVWERIQTPDAGEAMVKPYSSAKKNVRLI